MPGSNTVGVILSRTGSAWRSAKGITTAQGKAIKAGAGFARKIAIGDNSFCKNPTERVLNSH